MSSIDGSAPEGDRSDPRAAHPTPTHEASAAAAGHSDAAAAGAVSAATGGKPECYILVASVVKHKNVGMMMRSATAFGVTEMVIAGASRTQTFGSQGTDRYMKVKEFAKAREAVAYLKAKGVTICGIELTKDAAPVHAHPFRGPTAFFPGNEGDGLCDAHKALCDHFVYIPHYGNGTASLNVTVATSIVLHHFGVWAGYSELPREDGRDKIVVLPPPRKTEEEIEAERQARLAERDAESRRIDDLAEYAVKGFDDEEEGAE